MLDNDLFRAAIILILLLVALIFGNLKTTTNKLIYSLLILVLLGEIVTRYVHGYNLLHYSILSIIQITIIGSIVALESKKMPSTINIEFS